MEYLRIIVAPFISTALSFLVGYLLLSPNGFNLPAKAEKHYAEQDKTAAEEKYVAVDNKSMKWVRIGGVTVVISSLVFTIIVCFHDYLDIDGDSLTFMIGFAVLLWLCTLFDCTFFVMLARKVKYNEEGFTVINPLGIKRRHTYDEVVGISGAHNKTIKLKKGKVFLFSTMSGLNDFLNYLNEKRG